MADIAAAGPPMATATQRTALANHSLSTAPAATTTKADDPIYSAKDLVEAFKSSGAFDAIRADLMKAYLASVRSRTRLLALHRMLIDCVSPGRRLEV